MPDAQPPTYSACTHLEVPEIGARLWVAWAPAGLTQVHWADAGAGPPGWGAGLPQRPLPDAFQGLADYLGGADVEPAALSYVAAGTPFQERVWQALRQIGRGTVRSYAGVARDVGAPRAMRAVGAANGRNPVAIVVPCHRVVETGHRLGGYSGGLDRKRFLLSLEGVEVVGDRVQPGQLGLL